MDRIEAVLRELNLYPQWVRRNPPAPVAADAGLALARPACPELVETCPESTNIGVSCPSAGSGQTEINNFHADSSVATPAPQVDNLDWPKLKQQVRDCTACKLRAGCTQTVFGTGDEKAEWLFVGEGPGEDEDAQGEPFVGQAGKLLDNMLLAIKLRRGQNVYIANIVKCRPPGNRTPEADEIAACLPYLQRQIELIKPRLIVALGKTAATALLGRDAALGSLRGTLHDYRGIPLIATYHPAYLLRSLPEKAKAWQDLCFAVRARHGEA